MSREDLLLAIEDLEAKNANLAQSQVSLSNEIAQLRPEVEEIKKRRDQLLADLKEVEARIADKNAERDAAQDEREANILLREEQNETFRAELQERQKEYFKREQALEAERKSVNDQALINEANAKTLQAQRFSFEGKQTEIDRTIKSLVEDEQRLADLKAFFDIQKSDIDIREADVIAREDALARKEEALAALESLYAQKEQTLHDKDIALVDSLISLESQRKALKEEEIKVKENRDYAEGLLKIVEEERKKLELVRLQVNKKIQDNKLDLDLKELQK